MVSEVVSEIERPAGMKAFSIIWFGQLVSTLGSIMMQFGLMLWAWEQTGQATALALIGFFSMAPTMLMLPIAGSLVDRWNKKATIIISDLTAGVGTIALLILFHAGMMEIWHIYIVAAFVGIFGAFQFPAYSTTISMMVEKKDYARASGMVGMVGSTAAIFAPPMAAFLLEVSSLQTIMIIDIITFTFAIVLVLLLHIPNPPPASDLDKGVRGVLKDIPYGFRYIYKRKPLFGLQMTFFMFNLVSVFGMTVFNPMILARTGSNGIILALVQGIMAVGALVGGILLVAWGGPKKKIKGLLGGMILVGFVFSIGFGLGQNAIMWALFGFSAMLIVPTLNGSSQAIWQSKVPVNKQGRVFAARGVIAQGASAFAMVLVGPIADLYFEPAMAVRGSLAPTFGWLVGTGPGAGMALMIFISGIAASFVAIIAYGIKNIRDVERIIPDADPKNRLAEYKKRLIRAYKKGKLTRPEVEMHYRKQRARLLKTHHTLIPLLSG